MRYDQTDLREKFRRDQQRILYKQQGGQLPRQILGVRLRFGNLQLQPR